MSSSPFNVGAYRSNADSPATVADCKTPGFGERRTEYIKLVGLPFNCSVTAIKSFLGDVQLYSSGKIIYRLKNDNGGDSGKALVRMVSEEEAMRAATALHKRYIGWRYVEVYQIGPVEAAAHGLPFVGAPHRKTSTRSQKRKQASESVQQPTAMMAGTNVQPDIYMQDQFRSYDQLPVPANFGLHYNCVNHLAFMPIPSDVVAPVTNWPEFDPMRSNTNSCCSSYDHISDDSSSPCSSTNGQQVSETESPNSKSKRMFVHNPYQSYCFECPA